MSYAIVRNEKLTRAEINGKGTHNDRKAKNHTNKDIDPTRTHLNYYIKKNELTYTKEFDKYMKENNLQGHLRSNSIIMCQMMFTSDQAFFDKIGEKENNRLHNILNKFYETVDTFISWICHKFGIGESKELVKNFQKDTHTFIDPVKQLEHEEREKECDLEL